MNETLTIRDLSEPRPEVDAHSFAINYLSMDPEGFKLVTDNTVPKTDGLHLSDQEKALLAKGMQTEMLFNDAKTVRQAREAWKADKDNPALEGAFYGARGEYQNKGKKIGFRNLRVEDDVIHTDVQIVHFPSYKLFGQPDQSKSLERISRLVGVSMVVRTADNRLIIQHRAIERQHLREETRSRGNAIYSDIPGASVAGMLDATLRRADRPRGMPDPIFTDDVYKAIYKEGGEELGLAQEDFESVHITGVAEDKIKVHDELLLMADTAMTAQDIEAASRTSNRNKNLGDADFEEKFVDIEASPEAIYRLLTDVKCPLPPTHAAALTAAGFSIALERGKDFALAWRDQIEQAIRDNYAAMDEMVEAYYERFPEALAQVPERYWGKAVPPRNPKGYDPAYGPTEQGLPNFENEMVRVGLLPETRQIVKSAYLFDVDGPLSDPIERRVVEPELFSQIINRLKAGQPVGFNSGRSVGWMEAKVIEPLRELIGEDKALLERFIIIGEKGGTWLTFDDTGEPFHGKVEAITIPDELRDDIERLVARKYSDCVAVLDPKTTMLSLEMKEGYNLKEFKSRQPQLVEDIRAIITEAKLGNKYSVDSTTIAVDIESPHVGKNVGAERFLQHLTDLNLKVEHFEAFGDSPSDADMADELTRRGHSVTLVYVGSQETTPKQGKYSVVRPGDYSQGTLTYLKKTSKIE